MRLLGEFLGVIFVCLVVFSGIVYISDNTPTVYESYSTGKCIKAYKGEHEIPCESIDLKNDSYDLVWLP